MMGMRVTCENVNRVAVACGRVNEMAETAGRATITGCPETCARAAVRHVLWHHLEERGFAEDVEELVQLMLRVREGARQLGFERGLERAQSICRCYDVVQPRTMYNVRQGLAADRGVIEREVADLE